MTTIRGIATEDTTPDEDNVLLEGDDSSLVLPAGSVKMTIKNAVENTTFHAQAWRADHSDEIHSLLTLKSLPADDDVAAIEDSAASWAKKRVTLLGLVGTIAATKRAVRVATTANGALATAYANGQTIDGVTLVTGDRILLKDQSTASENGIYVVAASGAPARAADMPTAFDAAGSVVVASGEGTANPLAIYICSNDIGSGIVGSDNLVFGQPSLAGLDTSVTNQVAITANSESVIVDNDSATPSFRPDADNTWTLGENALRWQAAKVNAGAAATPSLSIRSDDLGVYSPAASQIGIATDGALAVKVEGTLDAATGNEVAYSFTPTINKATSGDYTALQVDVTETAAPGTANKLASFGVGGTPIVTLSSAGILATTAAGSTSAPSVAVRDASIGMYSPASNQVGLVANGEAIIVDNDSATPSLRPDVDSTWTLGETAIAWSNVYSDSLTVVSGGAAGVVITPGLIQQQAQAVLEINHSSAVAAAAGAKTNVRAQAGGATTGGGDDAAVGGDLQLFAGTGGDGDATYTGKTGGAALLQGGTGGANNGGGGGDGGAVYIRGGQKTGVKTDGAVYIGDTQTNSVVIGATGKTTTVSGPLAASEKFYTSVRALGTSTFTINGDDAGKICQWTGTSTGVAGTIDQGTAGGVVTIALTGTAGTITLTAGSGVTLEPLRGKTLTTNAPGASDAVIVTLIYLSSTYVVATGDLA